MLHLASESDPAWAAVATRHLDDVLIDHAHCEKKAAGAALRLIFQYPDRAFLQRPLAELAREELAHYQAVIGQLEARGVAFGRQKPSAYGGKLHACLRGREPDRLLDFLLTGALIEARSCERMQHLAEALEALGAEEAPLARFYRGLLASEARHHGLYLELACECVGAAEAHARLETLGALEAEAILEPTTRVRLHGAVPRGEGGASRSEFLTQRLAEAFDRTRVRVLAHQPHAPDLAGELAESAADLDPVPLEQ